MSDAVLFPLIVVGFLAAFSALWLAITSLLGWMSGWGRLERAFPDRPEPSIETLTFQSVRVRGVNYNNCIRFELCATGLRVSVLRLLGPFQRPFFVPWSQIRAERTSGLFLNYVTLAFGMRGKGGMVIRERAFERMAAVGNLSAV